MPAHRGQLPDSLAAASGELGSDLISPKVGFVPQLLRDRNPHRAPACPVDCGFSAAVLNLASNPRVCAFLALDSCVRTEFAAYQISRGADSAQIERLHARLR